MNAKDATSMSERDASFPVWLLPLSVRLVTDLLAGAEKHPLRSGSEARALLSLLLATLRLAASSPGPAAWVSANLHPVRLLQPRAEQSTLGKGNRPLGE